jgi:hypothetical protein
MWVAGYEKMGGCGARQGYQVIVSWVGGKANGNLRVGVNAGEAADESNVCTGLLRGHVLAKFGPRQDSVELGEQSGTDYQLEAAFKP